MKKIDVAIFWFRRDLRLDDNIGLSVALSSELPVIPLFIFDEDILDNLPEDDIRITFIYHLLFTLQKELEELGSSLLIKKGKPIVIWKQLFDSFCIKKVFFNHDYEPYAIKRDKQVIALLKNRGVAVSTYKDQVIFEKNEVLKNDAKPYTVFTPYKKKWLQKFDFEHNSLYKRALQIDKFYNFSSDFPSLYDIGFKESTQKVKDYNLEVIDNYESYRNIPAVEKTSFVSPYLRFGALSVRELVKLGREKNQAFLNELIWREFFMQILYHFPHVIIDNFKPAYNGIKWRNDTNDFDRWCKGETGYPMVDAGMRALNATGFMHNRVRMVTAGFLCKHLLIDWRWGEAYFAKKLVDYELASNNGNWQWAAGTGCDAAPYFRVFNPTLQQQKFDGNFEYIKKWIPEFPINYCEEIVEHAYARKRALATYKRGLEN